VDDKLARLAEVVRTARELYGKSQESLAKETGLPLSVVADIENGSCEPDLEVLFKIVRKLNIPTDHIFRPDKVERSLEKDLLIRAMLSLDEQDQKMIIDKTLEALRGVDNGEDV